MRFRGYLRAHLHRRLFVYFGVSIFAIGAAFAISWHFVHRHWPSPWQEEMQRATRFVGERFAADWDDAGRRRALVEAAGRELAIELRVRDARGSVLDQVGACPEPQLTVPVARAGTTLGSVEVCVPRARSWAAWRVLWPLAIAAAVLWAVSGKLAHRLTRPLAHLASVARDIGDGRLKSRARLRRHEAGEVGVLGEAINDMAAKIERQMAEQRELLAAVSHELRTPLARMRVLIELAAEGQAEQHLAELDREIGEMDALVGELLASSRLDFSALRLRPLDAHAVAARALERAGAPERLLDDQTSAASFQGDATLIARALANLLDNAKKHGGGVTAMRIKSRPGRLAFEVEDAGPGFSGEATRRLFQPFASGDDSPSSLGLGLALVRRIAEAHGGSAYAENRKEGGARVGFEVKV